MEFNCNGCGACCKLAGLAVEYVRSKDSSTLTKKELELYNFPYNYDTTGRCEMLSEDNKCMVYETRPDICSVIKTYNNHHLEEYSMEEYFSMGEESCISLVKMIEDRENEIKG